MIMALKNAPAQAALLQFIDSYKCAHGGNSPSRKAMAVHMKASRQNIDNLLFRLSLKGFITFDNCNHPMIVGEHYESAFASREGK
jgi:hypothetical protein